MRSSACSLPYPWARGRRVSRATGGGVQRQPGFQSKNRSSVRARLQHVGSEGHGDGGGDNVIEATQTDAVGIDTRVGMLDWTAVSTHLDEHGWALVEKLLTADECGAIAGLYDDDGLFRSHVIMARHGFGRGEYKYFGYPLPEIVADLRRAIYPHLAPIANRWNESMRIEVRYPEAH